jgi:hypothetical protein
MAVLGSAGLALSLASCKGSTGPSSPCVHPCDLAQCLSLEFSGGKAAEVTVGAGCHVNGGCPKDEGCAAISICLDAGFGTENQASCHVTATSMAGSVVESDVVATYTGDRCCAGYQFPSTQVTVSFDGSADADVNDGSGTGPDSEQPSP